MAPENYSALARPTLGHLDPYLIQIMDEINRLLRRLMGTDNELTLPISGTSSPGMEACLVDLLEWGTPVDLRTVAERLAQNRYSLVAMVHTGTSTAVLNPAAEIGEILQSGQTLYLLDTVTSLGGLPVQADAWGVDALYSGSQKCLSCPPELAPASFSSRAVGKILTRGLKARNWYLDMSLIAKYWEGEKRAYRHTAPINMLYGLYRALFLAFAEGLEAAYARHRRAHERLAEGLERLGLRLLVEPPFRLPMLNAVVVPEGLDEAEVRSRLREELKIEIGAGLGPLAGRIWRVGLMGHTAGDENVDRLLESLGRVLGRA